MLDFDEDGGVERAWLESEPHAHMLVEELMILANEAVGGLLAGRRREAPPSPRAARPAGRPAPAREACGTRGAHPACARARAPDPGLAARRAAETSERVAPSTSSSRRGSEAFPALVLRALKQARYDGRNLGHSGLASPAYAHFTSPIRRYPDLVVHRALLQELGVADEPLPRGFRRGGRACVRPGAPVCDIEYRADDICLAWLLESVLFDRGWDAAFEGEINGVIGSGLFVRFGEVFEGYVPVRRLGGDYYEVNESRDSRRAPNEADVRLRRPDRGRRLRDQPPGRKDRAAGRQPQLTDG